MLTRTPEQVALTETSRLCQQIADLCGDAADQASEAEMEKLLRDMAAEHDRVNALVGTRLRELDDLPPSPDPEWETLKKIAVRTKKIFAADEALVLLDARITDEDKLLAHLSDALANESDPRTRTCLEDVRRVASDSKRALEEERMRHDASRAPD